jgi:hypothetical protein
MLLNGKIVLYHGEHEEKNKNNFPFFVNSVSSEAKRNRQGNRQECLFYHNYNYGELDIPV